MGKLAGCCTNCSQQTKKQDKETINLGGERCSFREPEGFEQKDRRGINSTWDQYGSAVDDSTKVGDQNASGQMPGGQIFHTEQTNTGSRKKLRVDQDELVSGQGQRSGSADKHPTQKQNHLSKDSQGFDLIQKNNLEISPDGTKYTGQMKVMTRAEGSQDQVFIPHGYGTLNWPDGASYTGDIRDGKANGKGKFSHANGDAYQGDFVNDQAHGEGEYVYHEQQQYYKGQWQYDMQHGFGREELCDNSSYEGQFFQGKKQGFGKYIWADLSIYEGEWKENEMCGLGKFVATDKRTYVGNYVDSQFNGKGFYAWPDGRTYNGYYLNDKKQGFGIYSWPDGKKYEGLWNDGQQEGLGRFTNTKGQSRIGRWQQGKRQEWVTDQEEQQAIQLLDKELTKLENEDKKGRPLTSKDMDFDDQLNDNFKLKQANEEPKGNPVNPMKLEKFLANAQKITDKNKK